MMLEAANTYFRKAIATIERVMETQAAALDQAAQWIADSINADGVYTPLAQATGIY